MTPDAALIVSRMAAAGYGCEDVIVRLVREQIPLTSQDRIKIRRYVLLLGSKVERRYVAQ